MTNKPTTGDCECCPRTNQVIEFRHGNMWMCPTCIAGEDTVTSAIKTVETAKKIDSAIELKSDIFNAETVSFAELRAAIQNNPEIADDQKEYAYVAACAARIDIMSKAIFDEEQALIVKRNQRFAWLVETQEAASALKKAEERDKFKKYDVSTYNPNPITKKEKSTKPVKTTRKSPSKTELFEASKKYGVPAQLISMGMLSLHLSAEEVAKRYSQMNTQKDEN